MKGEGLGDMTSRKAAWWKCCLIRATRLWEDNDSQCPWSGQEIGELKAHEL